MSPISEIDSDNIIWAKPNNQHLEFLNPWIITVISEMDSESQNNMEKWYYITF